MEWAVSRVSLPWQGEKENLAPHQEWPNKISLVSFFFSLGGLSQVCKWSIGRFYWLNSKCFNVLTCLNIDIYIYIYILDIIYILIHNCIIPSLFLLLVLPCLKMCCHQGTERGSHGPKRRPMSLVAQKMVGSAAGFFAYVYSCRCTISINISISMNIFLLFFSYEYHSLFLLLKWGSKKRYQGCSHWQKAMAPWAPLGVQAPWSLMEF